MAHYPYDQLESSLSLEDSLVTCDEDMDLLCDKYLGNIAFSCESTSGQADVDSWQGEECIQWATNILRRHGIDDSHVDLSSLSNNTGTSLRQYSRQDFLSLVSQDHGTLLYQEFRKQMRKHGQGEEAEPGTSSEEFESSSLSFEPIPGGYDEDSDTDDFELPVDQMTNLKLDEHSSAGWQFDVDGGPQMSSMQQPTAQNYQALKKMSSTKKNRVRGPRNWEFLIRLLADKRTNPSLIRWEDEATATFRLMQPETIAKIWSSRSSESQRMCYNNFARGLRYHYKRGALEPVSEKQLVYRCGPKAIEYLHNITRRST